MARLTKTGISGLLGGLVFYELNGKPYVRSKPAAKTKKRKHKQLPVRALFGICSSNASAMGKAMKEHLHCTFGLDAYNTLRGWVRDQYAVNYQEKSWPLTTQYSGQCQLNAEADLRDVCRTDFTVKDKGNGTIQVSMGTCNPVKQCKAPVGTAQVRIKILAACSYFDTKQSAKAFALMQERVLPFTDTVQKAKTIQLHTGMHPDCICVITVAVEFEDKNSRLLAMQKYLPTAAVAIGRLV